MKLEEAIKLQKEIEEQAHKLNDLIKQASNKSINIELKVINLETIKLQWYIPLLKVNCTVSPHLIEI